jgi:hypothetical protein
MIKLLISGIWICAITLVSSYTAASWKAREGVAPEDSQLQGLNYEKTAAISIPIIADGEVKGYVLAQFVFTADARTLGRLAVPPHPFILDEAFRTIYADERIDFDHLEKFDLGSLTRKIRESTNARFATDLIKDVLVEQFTFVSKAEVRAQGSGSGAGPVINAGTPEPPSSEH